MPLAARAEGGAGGQADRNLLEDLLGGVEAVVEPLHREEGVEPALGAGEADPGQGREALKDQIAALAAAPAGPRAP